MRNRNFTIVLFLFIFSVGWSEAADFNKILNTVFRLEDKMDQEIKDAMFDGSFFYIETNDEGKVLKTISSKRHIYTKGFDKQKSEYYEMVLDGKVLSKKEMEKEAKKGRSEMQTKLPFAAPFRNKYEFSYLGEDWLNNKEVWKIGYKPKEKGKDNIEGFAYVLQSDTNIVQYQFVPVGLPFVLKNFNIILDYSKIGKYWAPTKFSLDMELDVKVIISFAHKFIKMQEEYTNYQFNTGIPDSFFEAQ